MIISLIKFFLIFFLVPYLIGIILNNEIVQDRISNCIYTYLIGLFMMIASFELLCIPMAYMMVRLHILFVVFSVLLILLCILSIFKIKKIGKKIFSEFKISNLVCSDTVYLLIGICVILIQLYFVVKYQSNWMSGDDAEYVTKTSTSIYLDRIVTSGREFGDLSIYVRRLFCSWEIFIAWLCSVSGINVPTMTHTVLNVSLVAIAYAVFYLLGCELFKDSVDRYIFLTIVAFANLFGLYSHYSLTFRWLMTMWQGKAVFMVIVFQFLFAFLLQSLKNGYSKYNSFIIFIISIVSGTLTPTGAGMFVGVLLVVILLQFIRTKEILLLRYCFVGLIFPAFFMISYLIGGVR